MSTADNNTIQSFVDDATEKAIAEVERRYAEPVKALEEQIPRGNGAWDVYEKMAALLAKEKGDVARAAFLTGLGYGIAMAHMANPSIFTQEPGVTH